MWAVVPRHKGQIAAVREPFECRARAAQRGLRPASDPGLTARAGMALANAADLMMHTVSRVLEQPQTAVPDPRMPGLEPLAERKVTHSPLRALSQRDFALLLAGAFVSNVGTWMERVAVGVWVTQTTGRAADTGSRHRISLSCPSRFSARWGAPCRTALRESAGSSASRSRKRWSQVFWRRWRRCTTSACR